MAKERGRGNLQTRERARAKVAALAWLRQRHLPKPLKVLLPSGMQHRTVLPSGSGGTRRAGGTRVLSQTVHREKATKVDQVEKATTGKGEAGSQ